MMETECKLQKSRRPGGKLSNNERVATGRVVQLIRLKMGLDQTDFSRFVGIGQGTLSKIERGLLEISVGLFRDLQKEFQISDVEWELGIIDHGNKVKFLNKLPQKIIELYGVPKRYNQYCGSSVRTTAPLIAAFKGAYGEKGFKAFLKQKGFKSDGIAYFYNFDNTININFSLDLMKEIWKKRPKKNYHLDVLNETNAWGTPHGKLEKTFIRKESSIDKLKLLWKNAHRYDANTNYSFDESGSGKKVQFYIDKCEHLKEFDLYDSIHGDIVGTYNKNFIQNFVKDDFSTSQVSVELAVGSKNQDRWIYTIKER